MSTMPALELNSVSKSYGRIQALNKVSISISDSEFIGLLGQNGAGKSTLFQLLTGLFSADSGDIKVYGDDIRIAPIKVLSKIGVVFQQSTLDLALSVQDNLHFHCMLHGLGRKQAKQRIQEELERFGLSDIANKPARSLSGGNRRKIELLRALLHRPSVLLMDEATVGLDPESRLSLLNHVTSLCKERGLAVLWCTHIVEEVQAADRVIVLDKGNVLAESSPLSLVENSAIQTDSLASAFLQLVSNNNYMPGVVACE
ncbi:MAG: ABC transporter ATP-binding protein [Motiliproteus sp.]